MRRRSSNHKIVVIFQMFLFKWRFRCPWCRCCSNLDNNRVLEELGTWGLFLRSPHNFSGPKKPFIKLRPAYSYIAKVIKIKITAKFPASGSHPPPQTSPWGSLSSIALTYTLPKFLLATLILNYKKVWAEIPLNFIHANKGPRVWWFLQFFLVLNCTTVPGL